MEMGNVGVKSFQRVKSGMSAALMPTYAKNILPSEVPVKPIANDFPIAPNRFVLHDVPTK